MANCPVPPLNWDIEEFWRERVLAAKARYERAAEQLRRLDSETAHLQEEAEAREEYRRILEVFSGYVLHGKEPREPD